MLRAFECTVTVRFDDSDVIDRLIDEGSITEEDAETYKPTPQQLRDYAWFLIEQDEGEYGNLREV